MSSNVAVNNLIDQALRTTSLEEITNLVKSPYMLVRRALTKNSNTPAKVLNTLANDPVMNVSYMAVQNPRSSVSRNFGDDVPICVNCSVDERKMDCERCESKLAHRF